ncbi:U6 snRNA-associated Sm-like protein LSm7 [Candida albicans P60002]|uniref:Sm-like protein n=2 Tax=Candida albicans TaxID=5476 RepID=A0A1D8PNP9_CANAL|nr:Sm-like protein [Candida albicans SC5314]KAF6059852.1 U6 snRNA-associated Sm-like protein LSm7 [Candida albicans]KGU06285.1 U6 snRNA-associated Sm-like protein LSm7 [Candida albicans 19F]KHC48686.1 U6 snRNA-associated Sm-like protein LSm7 [Candida albicans P60002]AOW29754.1 Sm-like protein [Candida albicans SC5314]KHC75235.1 U6 snRNA-associated Sm-like protein LSm7 [Candida albicans SC5314]|eukprot:XP_019330969.1 Sm-like protein [Candida albicans SC5314]
MSDERRSRQQQQYRRRTNNSNAPKQEGPKREAILDLNKYKDQKIRVKFIGGREVVGILKGFDQLMNLVLENVTETLRDPEDDETLTDKTRDLGLVVVRCTSLLTISPVDGSEIIDNPFIQPEQ